MPRSGGRWSQIDDSAGDARGRQPEGGRATLASRLSSWQCAALCAVAMAVLAASLVATFGRSFTELAGRAAAAPAATALASVAATPLRGGKTPSGSAFASVSPLALVSPSGAATASASASASGTGAPTPSGSGAAALPSAPAAGAGGRRWADVLAPAASVPRSWTVLATHPHDPDAFTQGLTWSTTEPGVLFEGTGMNGESGLRRVSLAGGRYATTARTDLPPRFFGEGVCMWTDAAGALGGQPGREVVVQLTWQERTGFIYDARTLEKLREFPFATTRNEGA
jgi:hypothetical protein